MWYWHTDTQTDKGNVVMYMSEISQEKVICKIISERTISTQKIIFICLSYMTQSHTNEEVKCERQN